jgi:hypothetical protein
MLRLAGIVGLVGTAINVLIQLRSGQLQGWWRVVPLAALAIWLAGLALTFT